MRDGANPQDIIAHAIHTGFRNHGDWRDWKPLADLVLAQLKEAGFGVVPVRLQDRRLAGRTADHVEPAAPVAP